MIQTYKGEFYILGSLLLWGFFPIISKILISNINYIFVLALSSFFALVYFLVIGLYRREWKYFQKNTHWKFLLGHSFMTLLGYLLIFYGLQYTSAINGSIFALTEVVFSYFIFGFLFTKEKIKFYELFGACLIMFGTLYVIFPGNFEVNIGDFIILFAMALAPLGNHFSKASLRSFSSNFIMLFRSLVTTVCFFLFGFIYAETVPSMFIVYDSLLLLIFSGVFLFGISKTFWIQGLQYITIPRASSFTPLYPILTMMYSIVFFGTTPTMQQFLGFVPIVLGILIFFKRLKIGRS